MGTPFYLTHYAGTCTGTIGSGKLITEKCAVYLVPSLSQSCGDSNIVKSHSNFQGLPIVFRITGDGKNFKIFNCRNANPIMTGGGTADEKSMQATFTVALGPEYNEPLRNQTVTVTLNLAFQGYGTAVNTY
jgi:hypothetical protein